MIRDRDWPPRILTPTSGGSRLNPSSRRLPSGCWRIYSSSAAASSRRYTLPVSKGSFAHSPCSSPFSNSPWSFLPSSDSFTPSLVLGSHSQPFSLNINRTQGSTYQQPATSTSIFFFSQGRCLSFLLDIGTPFTSLHEIRLPSDSYVHRPQPILPVDLSFSLHLSLSSPPPNKLEPRVSITQQAPRSIDPAC